MPASLSEFDSPRKTLKFARQELAQLEVLLEAFFSQANPYTIYVDTETDPERDKVMLELVTPLPDDIERLVTSALLFGRHGFDQALFAGFAALGRKPKDKNDTNFPWRESLGNLEHYLRAKVPKELWDVILKHEPYPPGEGYPGGDWLMREVASIANQKHSKGITLQPAPRHDMAFQNNVFAGGAMIFINFMWDAENNKMMLFSGPKGTNFAGELVITTAILFNQSPRLFGQPIPRLLRLFLDKLEAVIDDLERQCLDVRATK